MNNTQVPGFFWSVIRPFQFTVQSEQRDSGDVRYICCTPASIGETQEDGDIAKMHQICESNDGPCYCCSNETRHGLDIDAEFMHVSVVRGAMNTRRQWR